jgi:hypothetical protein
MYFYESDRPRCWRPDLVSAILKWVDGIPADSLKNFRAFHVNEDGSFGASFSKRSDRGGPPRDIRFEFDHGGSSLHVVSQNELKLVGVEAEILPFSAEYLTMAADAADTSDWL